MNKRVQTFNEKLHVHESETAPFKVPIRVCYVVSSRWGPGDNFSRKTRPTLSLNLITRGNATYWQDGRTGQVGPGQIFLAHRSQSQQLMTGDEGFLHKRSVVLWGVALDAVVSALRLTGADVITPHDLPAMMRLFREAYRCVVRKSPGSLLELSTLAWRILLECGSSMGATYPPALRKAIDYINANAHSRLTVKQIAAKAGLSPRHCTRLFRSHLECSPLAFCIRQRLAVAQSLVVNTNRPLKLVADELGYEDQFYFSSQFRRHFGMSPSALRRESGTDAGLGGRKYPHRR